MMRAAHTTEVEARVPQGEFVRADGVPVHYVRSGSGPPVIYIHGAKSSVYDFTMSIADEVAERYTAVAFDRPGAGFSGRPASDGGSPQAQAAVLRAAAGVLGLERPILLGHSFGAAVALAWALDAQDEVSAVVTLGGYVLPDNRLDALEYAHLFERLGFHDQQVRMQVYGHRLPSREEVVEWVRGSFLNEYKARLCEPDFERFFSTYRDRLLAVLPDERPFFFTFKRLLMWAALPGTESA